MSNEFVQYLLGLATGYYVELTAPSVGKWIDQVFVSKPELSDELKNATNSEELEHAMSELAGEIEALAGSGAIKVDQATIEAIKSIKFDHQNGVVTIQGGELFSSQIKIGGSGVGSTHMVNTKSMTPGTMIEMKGGANITLEGNAQINQRG